MTSFESANALVPRAYYLEKDAVKVMMMPESQPTNPNVPSLLTMVPEIRNRFYRMVFTREEPVMVIDPAARKLARNTNWGCEKEWAIDPATEFTDLGAFMSLLRTCRQIYHEAAPILYGENTFLVSWDHTLHHHGLQVAWSGRWMAGLGSQVTLLNKVVIDLDAVCPLECFEAGNIDLLPLAKIVWTHPDKDWDISFQNARKDVNAQVHMFLYDMATGFQVDGLNKFLAAGIFENQCKLKALMGHLVCIEVNREGTMAFSPCCFAMLNWT